ncbi:MAG: bifunctional folylpolyglutamate synthase/dihydrofolate synthase [Bacteroidales bacterium]
MTYQQTLDYLYAQLPMFHRIGPAAYKANLDNTIALAKHLGNPERKFKTVHVAGTNGKGSVSHMLASVFQEAGYKTGLCTSPHLKDFRERFRINGAMISKEFVTDFVSHHKTFFESIQPSFFEMTIAMAFDWFARQGVDIAIIETGLGGRLDSTNIILPVLSVLTNVGYDHVNLLGNTLQAIAREKAGIIKQGVPVVVGKCRPEVMSVFEEVAAVMSSGLTRSEETCRISQPSYVMEDHARLVKGVLSGSGMELPFECPLSGSYQLENICTVATAVEVIRQGGEFVLTHDHLVAGLRNVIRNTSLMGRWQILNHDPLVICDTGHNEDGIRSILENISITPHEHLHFVLGMMNDKDVEGILKLLPTQSATYYFCKPDVPRGLDTFLLAAKAADAGLIGQGYLSVKEALRAAMASAGKHDLVFVGGSTFVVAEVV